jgi:hypothetical protein
MKKLCFIFIVAISFGCQTATKNNANQENYTYYREDGLMRDEFWGKDEESDIPAIFEAVSVDKNGKVDGKGGDTHFEFLDEEVGISYYSYDSPELALEQLNKSIKNAKKVVRKGVIKNSKGDEVGQKVLIIQKSKVSETNFYSLKWTCNSRWTSLSSDSLKAIEAYEIDRKL